jgi:hypothetical protein
MRQTVKSLYRVPHPGRTTELGYITNAKPEFDRRGSTFSSSTGW